MKTDSLLKSILELSEDLIRKTFEDPEQSEVFGMFVVYKLTGFINRVAEGIRDPLLVQAEAKVMTTYLKGIQESGLCLMVGKREE